MTTEPQTAAGRALLASLHAQAPVHVPVEQDAASILAIEREARSGLDAGLLARAIAAVTPTGTKYPERLAAEYDRLARAREEARP